jgi:hypothetical protein
VALSATLEVSEDHRCQDSLRSRNVETVGFKWARSVTPARPNGFPLTERLVICDQGISDRDRLRRQSERARARPERDRGGRVEKRLAFISNRRWRFAPGPWKSLSV